MEEAETEALLGDLLILPLTAEIARRAGDLMSRNARMGRTFALADMIVAATALQYDCTVLTDNRKDFDVVGLTLYPLPLG